VTDAEIGVLVDTGTERLPLFEYWTAAAADTEVRELVLTAPEPRQSPTRCGR